MGQTEDGTAAERVTQWARLASAVVRSRADAALALLDAAIVAASFALVLLLRFDGTVPGTIWERFGSWLPVAIAVALLTNWSFGLYGQVWRYASAQEARRLLGAMLSTLLVLSGGELITGRSVPWSVIVLGTGVAAFGMGAVRFQSRLFSFYRHDGSPGGSRVVVLGAKDAGATLIAEMQRFPGAGLHPVAVLDPAPARHGRTLLGLQVAGGFDRLPATVRATGADVAILAMSSVSAETVRQAAAAAEEAGIALKIVGGLVGRVKGSGGLRSVRDLQIDDLIGRAEVRTDLEAVRRMLVGRRVLITGAGGSIGSEIARQVARCAPAVLIALDHDESHLHDMAASITETPVLQVLADIRDDRAVDRVFDRHRPELVFHAAAHKHVPLLEDHPAEAVRTNITGTANLLAASAAVGVERFVFISTDKAVEPSSVMGASKRVGEHLVLSASGLGSTHAAVRFGNVLGSRGSVVPTFARQIADGGPVTVTDARMTRYFMSIEEAVQLVLQAAAMASGGDLFVLDMGEPVRILDLAERMIRLAGLRVGADIEVRVTGVRPGEKLEEELLAGDEPATRTTHPAISRVEPTLPAPEEVAETVARLRTLANELRDDDVRSALFHAAQQGAVADAPAGEPPDLPSASGRQPPA
ncbi:MAG: nucleoside-diphosphate sugar epimerase/dehydratase [Acidimicrobiales bacterium]